MAKQVFKGIKHVSEGDFSGEAGYLYFVSKEGEDGYIQMDGKYFGTDSYGKMVKNAIEFRNVGEEDVTISLGSCGQTAPVLEYSIDSRTWETWDYSGITIGTNQSLYIRGNNPSGFSSSSSVYSYFVMTSGAIECYGNVMALIDYTNLPNTIPNSYCFFRLFSNCRSLTKAPKLPATGLTESCYNSMFQGCTSLVDAPKLSCTTLAEQCYQSMFAQCTSLTTAPYLPATTLDSGSYQSMFYGCTSLKYLKIMALSPTQQSINTILLNASETGKLVKNREAAWSADADAEIPSGWTVITEDEEFKEEYTTNKVTSLSSSSTDDEYPSAKCVYDMIGNIEALLSQI